MSGAVCKWKHIELPVFLKRSLDAEAGTTGPERLIGVRRCMLGVCVCSICECRCGKETDARR